MKNVEYMKNFLIGLIRDATVDQLNSLNVIFTENDTNDFCKKAVMLTCKECRKLYGECDDGEIGRVPCDDRFKIFLNSEHVIKGDEV